MVGLGSGAVLVVAVVLGRLRGVLRAGATTARPSTTTSTTAQRREHRPAGLSGDRRQGSEAPATYHNAFAIPKAFQTLLPRTQAVYLTLAEKKVVAKAIKQAVDSGQPILAVEGKTAFTGIVNSANARKGVIPIP